MHEMALAEGILAEAALEIEEVSARLHCKRCGAEDEFEEPPFNCRRCGASEIEIVSGDELLVDAVELEGGITIQRPSGENQEILEEILEDHLKEHAMDNSDDQEEPEPQ
jgi:hydrogenase/urease nickel incorporation metallochaperone HypA